MRQILFLFLVVSATSLFIACQKEGPAGPPGATGPAGPAGPAGPGGTPGLTDTVTPRMYAWGTVDSFGVIIIGSENFTVTWDVINHWYRIGFTSPFQFYRDSTLVFLTPKGNGSWDQITSVGEQIISPDRYAIFKFTDANRLVAGFNTLESRRRSLFNFTLYDLRIAH
jgi:hypothetical protein